MVREHCRRGIRQVAAAAGMSAGRPTGAFTSYHTDIGNGSCAAHTYQAQRRAWRANSRRQAKTQDQYWHWPAGSEAQQETAFFELPTNTHIHLNLFEQRFPNKTPVIKIVKSNSIHTQKG